MVGFSCLSCSTLTCCTVIELEIVLCMMSMVNIIGIEMRSTGHYISLQRGSKIRGRGLNLELRRWCWVGLDGGRSWIGLLLWVSFLLLLFALEIPHRSNYAVSLLFNFCFLGRLAVLLRIGGDRAKTPQF